MEITKDVKRLRRLSIFKVLLKGGGEDYYSVEMLKQF